jgi:hypothetical protein
MYNILKAIKILKERNAVHYVFANFKMMSNTRMKSEIFNRNFHLDIGEQLTFAEM